MVSFEEMIRSLDLKNVILKFLMNSAHPKLKNISDGKIDMDKIQAGVLKNLPYYTLNNGILVTILSAVFFALAFLTIHGFIVIPVMHMFSAKLTSFRQWHTESLKV